VPVRYFNCLAIDIIEDTLPYVKFDNQKQKQYSGLRGSLVPFMAITRNFRLSFTRFMIGPT